MESFSDLVGSNLKYNEDEKADIKICDGCGKSIESSEVTLTESGGIYCEHCFHERCAYCESCHKPNERINLIYTENCAYSDGEYYCEACYAEATNK